MSGTTISVTEARARLPEMLDRVVAGDEITITRHDTPIAVLVSPDSLRVRRAGSALSNASRVHDMLASARARPLAERGGLRADRADELAVEVDASRSPGR